MSEIPRTQSALLLHGAKQDYELIDNHPVPEVERDSEILVENRAIGLNPIDWKAPDFNFGLPQLPYIAGRELAGVVVKVPSASQSWKIGDRVAVISTDYRDLRKAAYQQYVVAQSHTVVRLPQHISFEDGSTFGVAFAAASIALGVSLGLDFSSILDGPDLFKTVREIGHDRLPSDIRDESLHGIESSERAKSGDWIAIWGGSATSANLTIQLAKLAGVKVAVVVDSAKHGIRLSAHPVIRPDLLVDSHDPKRAIEILRASTQGNLRYGLDTRGKESAGHLLKALENDDASGYDGSVSLLSPPGTPSQSKPGRRHLVGLTGLPKDYTGRDVQLHTVPIKLFHESAAIGESLTSWATRLLEKGILSPPDIIDVECGLRNVNIGLNRMRRGEICGGKLVVRL